MRARNAKTKPNETTFYDHIHDHDFGSLYFLMTRDSDEMASQLMFTGSERERAAHFRAGAVVAVS